MFICRLSTQFNSVLHIGARFVGLNFSSHVCWAGSYFIIVFLEFLCVVIFITFSFQGCCIGQGTYSELSTQGLDVQSLVSVPESDTDSAIDTDDIEIVERKRRSSSTQTTSVKPVV